MAQYRKKPVVIDAWQYINGNLEPMPDWVKEAVVFSRGKAEARTLEGTMIAEKGDWILRGVKGEVYPCKDEIFAATYELA